MPNDDAYAFRFEGKEYRLPKLMLAEARAMQKATGKTILQIGRALNEGDADCLTALIWVAMKRETPALKFDEVDGDVLSFEWVDDEDEPVRAEGNGQEILTIQAPDPASP